MQHEHDDLNQVTENETAEVKADETTRAAEDFEKMVEATVPKKDGLAKGDQITGSIIDFSEKFIFIELGEKVDAIAEKAEYLDAEGNFPYQKGDQITGYVVKLDDSEMIISKSLTKSNASKSALRDAFERSIPVTGRVDSAVKGGFSVTVLGMRAFCPASQIDVRPSGDNTKFLGKSFEFQITDFDDNGRNLVVSRRQLMDRENESRRNETMSHLEVGAEVEGVVTRLASFGAFVDLGGIEGMVHVSEMSWYRIDNPEDAVKTGDKIKVKIIKLDGERISLSIKQCVPNPLESALDELNEGDVVSCRVVKNEAFGSFVELMPGVQGLIPISELRRGGRIGHPSEILKVGDQVSAKIIKIHRNARKISLSLKELEPDPWEQLNPAFQAETEVTGVIEGVSEFGVFVRLQDGINGLLPKSRLRMAHLNYTEQNMGEEITVRISEINHEKKRISLSPLNLPSAPAPSQHFGGPREPRYRERDEEWRKYAIQNREVPEDNPFRKL
jgi:small subunit ribosomal protein S1